jgi:PST family polysaccharide transporter
VSDRPSDDHRSDPGRTPRAEEGQVLPESAVTTPTKVAESAKPADALGARTARGAGVTLMGQAARAVLQMASVVVLARLLSPRDYGLLALVLVVVGVGEILRDFGLSTAAIQAKNLSREQQDTLFWLNAGLGAILAVLAFCIAPLYAMAFHQPALEHMVQVLALIFVINGVAAQYRADLNRRMRFAQIAASDVLGQAMGLVVGVTCAELGAGYWSLVAQQLAQVFTALLVLGGCARWLPRRPKRGTPIGTLLRMGGHLAVTRIVYYFMNNLDTLTIGIRFSPVSLGIYNRAFQLMNRPLSQMLTPTTTVALPVLARLQDDYERAAEYIKRAQLAIGYTVVPCLAVAAGASKPVVALLLGSRWGEVVPIFALLAVAGGLSTLAYVGRWVYLSRGLAADLMRYTTASFVLQLLCILIGSIWGVLGVAWGYMIASAVEWPLSILWLSRLTVLPRTALLQGAARICVCAAGAGLVAFGVSRSLPLDQPAVGVVAAAVAAAIWYGICTRLSSTVRSDLAGVRAFGRRMIRR